MTDWQTIDTAPQDGTPVLAGKMNPFLGGTVLYPLTSRYIGGRWKAKFGDEWASYDPQPTHWTPAT